MISIVNGPACAVLSLAEWKTAARARRAPDGVMVRKSAEAPVVSEQDRTLRFTISSGSVDRDGDTINPEGWKLENYLKNPVVMWAHSYDTLPIGRATGIWVQGGRLLAAAEFPTEETYPFGHQVFRLLKGGFLGATSVGFAPIKHVYNEERRGVDFLEQELLEFSIVSVPANPEALVEASKKSFDRDGVLKWLNGTAWRAGGEPIRAADPGSGFLVDDELIIRGVRKAVEEQLAAAIHEAVVPAVRSAVMRVTGRVD